MITAMITAWASECDNSCSSNILVKLLALSLLCVVFVLFAVVVM